MLRRRTQFSMAATQKHPTTPTSASAAIPNLVRILTSQNLLSTGEQEQVERYMKVQQLSEEAALRRLGKLSEDEITEAVAKHVELPYLKINPLDLDLDVVTAALPAPSRKPSPGATPCAPCPSTATP